MKKDILDLTYMAAYAALAMVLDLVSEFIPFLKMPNGGTISLAVIPIFICSYHLGYIKGMICSLLWWGLGFINGGNNYFLNVPQYILDYILPALAVGMASIFPKISKVSNLYIGLIIGGLLRFISTVLSGVYYWFPSDEVAGSIGSWIFSLKYNLGYNLATLIISILIVPLLIRTLSKRIKLVGLK